VDGGSDAMGFSMATESTMEKLSATKVLTKERGEGEE
jgi:hypothetical protein